MFCKSRKEVFIRMINKKAKFSSEYFFRVTFFALLLFTILIQSSASEKVFAQAHSPENQKVESGNAIENPFSWEIKPVDVNPEFLRKWGYNFNVSSQPTAANLQKQIR